MQFFVDLQWHTESNAYEKHENSFLMACLPILAISKLLPITALFLSRKLLLIVAWRTKSSNWAPLLFSKRHHAPDEATLSLLFHGHLLTLKRCVKGTQAKSSLLRGLLLLLPCVSSALRLAVLAWRILRIFAPWSQSLEWSLYKYASQYFQDCYISISLLS